MVRLSHKRQGGLSKQKDEDLYQKAKQSIPFNLTKDQEHVLEHIQSDLISPYVMNRLLQGDVGSGKTVVAFLSAVHVISSGFQVALMAPTEILAKQHFESLAPFCESLGLKYALLTGKLKKSEKNKDKVLAVLFRDSDGTASSGRGEWQLKRDSMKNGFAAESYDLAVAMMPKPKSEAWLICALKENPYQACDALEDRSGNDDSPKALKTEFDTLLNEHPSKRTINELIDGNDIDADRIDMESMKAFKADLKIAVEKVFPQGNG